MASKLLGSSFKTRMLAARAKRFVRFQTRMEWFGNKFAQKVTWGIATRIKLACQLLRDKVVLNISYPVTKIVRRGRDADGHVVTRTWVDPESRSKPGQFPHADTTRLMKDIYWVVDDKILEGRVGTTLDYGLILETKMDRSFLVRTWNELRATLVTILLHGGNENAIFHDTPPVGPSSSF